MAAPRPHPWCPRVSPALLSPSLSEVSSPDPSAPHQKGCPSKGSPMRPRVPGWCPPTRPRPRRTSGRTQGWPGGQEGVRSAGTPHRLALTAPPLPCPAETPQGHHGPQAAPEERHAADRGHRAGEGGGPPGGGEAELPVGALPAVAPAWLHV